MAVADEIESSAVKPMHDNAPRFGRAFFRWGASAYGLTVLFLVVRSGRITAGAVVYPLDDAAIHLSIADTLVHHGTWGVVPGEYQSASSSPVWTLLVAGWLALASVLGATGLDSLASIGPFLLNIAPALLVIAILGGNQRVLAPSRHRPFDAAGVVILCVPLLFLPALTMLGMEHTLHMSLVLGSVVLFARHTNGDHAWGPSWLPYVLLGIATLTRFETLFVAAGLAVAQLAMMLPGWRPSVARPALHGQVKRATLIGVSAGVPFAVFALFNRAMGQGWLPNSVLAKGQSISGEGAGFAWSAILNRFTSDSVLAVGTLVLIAALMVNGRRSHRFVFPGIVVVVATAGHVVLAQIGWYERYQAYLLALLAFALLLVAEDFVPADRRAPARSVLVPILVALGLLLSEAKVELTWEIPMAVNDTYQQRYQAARFVDRYYDDDHIATSELGYMGLTHDGPITDVLGLGDYEILQQRIAAAGHPPAAYWRRLAVDRGFDVVVMYPSILLFDTPTEWILVGEWHINRSTFSALEPTLQFWATTPQEVSQLEANLREFEASLPSGPTLTLNPLAQVAADEQMATD
jgi:hypothetical protein